MLVAAAKGRLLLCLILSLAGAIATQVKQKHDTSAQAVKEEYEDGLHVMWDDIRLDVAATSRKSTQILKGVYGDAKPGRLLVSNLICVQSYVAL
jgi:hypothetical protein